ncbi:MAG: hypothetical protein ABIK09_16295 [Pseudomonadota bacterium]
MKRIFALVLIVLACSVPLAAQADCPGDCVETCSAGPSEDYATCLDSCLAGCTPDPVPPVPEPTPVPES